MITVQETITFLIALGSQGIDELPNPRPNDLAFVDTSLVFTFPRRNRIEMRRHILCIKSRGSSASNPQMKHMYTNISTNRIDTASTLRHAQFPVAAYYQLAAFYFILPCFFSTRGPEKAYPFSFRSADRQEH